MEHPNAIRRYREAKNWSLEELAEHAGVSVSQVSRIERGQREPTVANMKAFARALGVSVNTLIESGQVLVVGYVGAGAQAVYYSDAQGPLEKVERPPESTEQTVAVIVRGDSMTGIADDGWVLYYDEQRTPPTSDLLGKLCIVGLSNGHILVKKLQRGRGPGLFDLYSVAGAPMLDQPV